MQSKQTNFVVEYNDQTFYFLVDTIRLVNGSRPWNGRVEVKYNGSWAVVCDDLFSVWSATVVCTMLGVTGQVIVSYIIIDLATTSSACAV